MSMLGYPDYPEDLSEVHLSNGVFIHAYLLADGSVASVTLSEPNAYYADGAQYPRELIGKVTHIAWLHTKSLSMARFFPFGMKTRRLVASKKPLHPARNWSQDHYVHFRKVLAGETGATYPLSTLTWMPGAKTKAAAALKAPLLDAYEEKLRVAYEHCDLLGDMADHAKTMLTHAAYTNLTDQQKAFITKSIAADQTGHAENAKRIALLKYLVRQQFDQSIKHLTDPLKVLEAFETITAGSFAAADFGNPRSATCWGLHEFFGPMEFAKAHDVVVRHYREQQEDRAAHTRNVFSSEGHTKKMAKLYKLPLSELAGE